MRPDALLTALAAVILAYGIILLLVPSTAVRAPRAALGSDRPAAVHFTDAPIAGIAPFPWLYSRVEPGALPVVYLALFLAGIAGAIAVSMGRLSGVTDGLGRGIAVLYLLLAVGLGRYRLAKPTASRFSTCSGAMCSMGCALPLC